MARTKQLGKYEIIEELGKGGFATVYRARDPDLDREVALKVLDPLLTRDPVWVARFRREARAVARLRYPNIVTVYEIGQAEGRLHIAMELVDGPSLKDRIAQGGRLSWDEALELLGQVADALDYAHGEGVLHRDLKPDNILLDDRQGAMLTDFGFAKLVGESSMSVSISGGVVGTPAYIAPEVWEGQPATPQTDIYALGCILYEMVVGQHLFQGNTNPSVMRAHFQPVVLPEAWPEGVPPGLEAVLEKALAKEPGERYACAGELAEALAALREDPLAAPYATLEAAVAAGEWEQALELARAIRGEDADYGEVVALEEAALAGLDRAVRAREAAAWRAEAERALAEGDLRGVEMAARRWGTLAPEDPSLREFLHRVQQARAATKAEPLPKPQPQRATAPAKAQDIPSPAASKAAWWLLGISILLGLPAFGAGFIGIVGAVAMLRGRPWGRKVGLSFAILFETAGFIAFILMTYDLLAFVQWSDEFTVFWLGSVATLAGMSAGILLALLLNHEAVVRGMGEEPRTLTGGWAMAVPAVLTVVGIPPAVGLLRNRRWGQVTMAVFLIAFALTAVIGISLLSGYMLVYDGPSSAQRYRHNDWGIAVAIVEATVVAIWCLAGFFYLNSPRVRAWFVAHDHGIIREI